MKYILIILLVVCGCVPTSSSPFCDINGDGGYTVIDDLSALMDAYGKHEGDADWNYYADFNHDGEIDIYDKIEFSETCSPNYIKYTR